MLADKYGDERRSWKAPFIDYMKRIVTNRNYVGMPDAIDEKGQIRWNAPSNRPPGKWQDLRDRRLEWWKMKALEVGVETKGEWISKVAKRIHPFGEKPCQTCGRLMSLEYVYPTKNTLNKINRNLSSKYKLRYEDFLTIYEIIPIISKHLGKKAFEIFENIFPLLKGEGRTEQSFIESLSTKIVPLSPRGKLSPGAMSNAPDRLDGFHTYNLCCRNKQDTGRSAENLRTYADDRRAFEFWCEGDWAAANQLMTSGGIGQCPNCKKDDQVSADHVGPISLGFRHMPWFKPLCSSCNSSKGNRLSLIDIKQLTAKEKTGEDVVSFQIKKLWNKRKGRIKTDIDASNLSKILRINQHYYLLLLKEFLDSGYVDFLLTLLSPELAAEKVEFIKLDPKKFTFQRIIKQRRADTYSRSKAARMVRIAFDALKNYGAKGKRNIHSIPKKIDERLRTKVISVLDAETKKTSNPDKILRSKLIVALESRLGDDERDALFERALANGYKPRNSYNKSRAALIKYTDTVGLILDRQ